MSTMPPKVFWYYRQANQSPLVTSEFLMRQRRVLMPAQYAREHQNSWVDAADSFTSAAEVDAAMGTGWTEHVNGRPGCMYEHFWDLGSVKDPTVGGVGHAEIGLTYIDTLVTFQGSHEAPVLLPVVKQAMIDLARRFPPKRIRIESWQGLSAAQELKAEGLPVELFAPTAKAHAEEWPVLAQRLSSRTLVLFPHARLREELLNLTYEVGLSGVRVIDKGKIHQDHAVAVRGVVAGLSGPVLPPWTFHSEGRALHVSFPQPVLADQPPTQTRERTIEEIEHLDEGVRSPDEQARLTKFYEERKRNHVETAIERVLRNGSYFPGSSDGGLPVSGDWRQAIRERFQRWR